MSVCKHGESERQCERCDLEKEVARLRDAIKEFYEARLAVAEAMRNDWSCPMIERLVTTALRAEYELWEIAKEEP